MAEMLQLWFWHSGQI